MNLTNPELYLKISNYQLDDYASELKFSQRLMRENLGWSQEYADRVIHEYKRFMYLACVANHPVTPSDEVDQAWHLHLLYSQDYVDWCILMGKTIYHGPTKGGSKEGMRYEDQYKKTQMTYGREFSQHPPDDIWPSCTKRFSTPYARVNLKDNWVIPVGDWKGVFKLIFKCLKARP